MTTTTSAVDRLDNLLRHVLPTVGFGWSVSRSSRQFWTVSVKGRGSVKCGYEENWRKEAVAQGVLRRLEVMGLNQVLSHHASQAKKSSANGHSRGSTPLAPPKIEPAFQDAAMTVPADQGEPSPQEGVVSRRVFITPEMAKELRARPWNVVTSKGVVLRQRKLEESTVEDFCDFIRRKTFRATYQGIGILANGTVADGQHRLEAIIRTGIGVWCTITFNVDPDDVEALDGGRQRRASTKLYMAGYEHALQLGSSARLLHYYLEYEAACELSGGEVLIRPWRLWHNEKINDSRVQDIVEAHPNLYPAVQWSMTIKHRKDKDLHPSAVAVMRYLVQRNSPGTPGTLDDFLTTVVKRIGITSEVHTAFAVEKWVARTAESQRLRRFSRESHLHVLIKAWNAHLRGKLVKHFPDELPEVFPLVESPKPR